MSTLGLKWEGYTERGVWATKSNTSPELVYQLVAPNFTDLVWKIEVQKSLWNTDKYKQVVISSDESAMEMKEKGLVIERSDYFSALKVFCLKFSYEHGLQSVKIFGRKKRQISIFLVPPGSFFNYDRKRNQIDATPYFNYKYQVNQVKQGNYSLRRPPKIIIPKIFTKQRWATVYGFMCNRICKSKQAYMTRAKVMSSLRDKINQKLLTFKRTPSP